MAQIDDLLDRVEDAELREKLRSEVAHLRRRTTFGLVFERHIPEEVLLYDHPITVGDRVLSRKGSYRLPRVVRSLTGTSATLESEGASSRPEKAALRDLGVLKRLGDDVLPALETVGVLVRGEDGPFHAVIDGENFHVLQLLNLSLRNKIDCIYIDPPYNTGAKDWRYNNRFVEKQDSYRHSKWLAFMERRLLVAQRLLKEDGVVVVTVDENEHAHLVMLLERVFRASKIVSIAVEHNRRGVQGDFAYTNEFAVFVYGREAASTIAMLPLPEEEWEWAPLRNWGGESERSDAANCFYPIYAREGEIVGFGDVLPDEEHPADKNESQADGTVAIWPIDKEGAERKWRYARQSVERIADRLRVTESGKGKAKRLDVDLLTTERAYKTVWTGQRYDANYYGTQMVTELTGEKFPFPKSLYTTYDALNAATGRKPDAVILDFFAGSGTTLHATALLNAADGGRRRCLLVTNNEVAAKQQTRLRRDKIYRRPSMGGTRDFRSRDKAQSRGRADGASGRWQAA